MSGQPSHSPHSAAVDLARVIGAVLIVLTHAAVAYIPSLPEGLLWPVHDPGAEPSVIMRPVFLYGRLAGVGMFFVLAGSLGAASLARGRPAQFAASRMSRLGLPLLIGACTVLPVTYFVWGFDALRRGYIRSDQLWGFKLSNADKDMLLGPAHLWFLEYLLAFSLLAAVTVALVPRALEQITSRRAASLMVCGCGLAMMVCVWLDPTMLTGFRNDAWPRPAFFVFNACLYIAGSCVRADLKASVWPWLLLLSAPLMILPAEANRAARVSLIGAPVLTLAASFGWLGLASRFAKPSAMLSRLGSASFGVYLVHLPVVCALQLLLRGAHLASELKFFLCGLLTVVVCFSLSLCFTKNKTGLVTRPVS